MNERPMSNAELVKRIKDGTVTEEDFNAMQERTCQRAVEMAMRTVPQVVDHVTKQAFLLRKLSHEFYKNNPELAQDKELVARTIEKLEGDNPGATYEQLLAKVPGKVQELKQAKEKLLPDPVKRPDTKKLDDRFGEL